MLILGIRTPGHQWHTVGYVWCHAIAPVANYTLGVPAQDGDAGERAHLRDYSRWSEPACALVARLLAAARGSVDTLAAPAPHRCELDVRIGPDFARSRRIEHVHAHRSNGSLSAARTDEHTRAEHRGVERQEYANLASLLEHACRLAAWGSDVEPPIPEPLSKVPLHRGPGDRPVVRADDIPAHPRLHFEASRIGATQPAHGLYYAHDWFAFIGA